MKYLLVVEDGIADYPVPELGNKTPLQAAYKPNMDSKQQNAKAKRDH
jgi:2,3-bisphosphoglycerate-independent phosphoglycerate mutase